MVMLFLPSIDIIETFESELHKLTTKAFFLSFFYTKKLAIFFLRNKKKIEFTLEIYELPKNIQFIFIFFNQIFRREKNMHPFF
jgi:hypothetical protein